VTNSPRSSGVAGARVPVRRPDRGPSRRCDGHEHTKLLAESREHALDRMVQEARSLGANAIIGTAFMTSYLAAGTAELLAYGTAVVEEDT
jgi:uncharacterized protein YbjQ (UPF0145 family)